MPINSHIFPKREILPFPAFAWKGNWPVCETENAFCPLISFGVIRNWNTHHEMQRCVCLRNRNAQTVEKCTVLCVKSSSPTHTCAATCESRYARAIKQENHHYFLVIFESKQPAMDKKIDRAIRNVSMLQTKRHILVLLWSRKDLQTPNGKNRWVQMHAIKPKLVLFTQHMMCFNVERYVFFLNFYLNAAVVVFALLLLLSSFSSSFVKQCI